MVPIVLEFLNLFPNNILGFPPVRKVEFTIDIVPKTKPICKTPYRMRPAKLQS